MAQPGNKKLIQTGIPDIQDACFAIVRTEWNGEIVDELEKGCIEFFSKSGVKDINVVSVPGAFEIPFGVRAYWETHKYSRPPKAIIALGCVIKGDTPHFDYICRAVTDGILQLNLTLPIPVIFGVLTVNNVEQAQERTGGQHGHKGEEAALTALKMTGLHQFLKRK
jgi:6,7-dimethyl-8-ribityllumazine synthase